jgi:thiamine-phosphate pyrophosphorylase
MSDAEPRLYLVSPRLCEAAPFLPLLRDALSGGGVASLLLRLGLSDEAAAARLVGEIAPVAQAQGVALIIDGAPQLVRASGADGAHVAGAGDELTAAIKGLAPDFIVGAGALATRHDAMVAGEAGADYLLFGDLDEAPSVKGLATLEERINWWSELFTTPCVAYVREPVEIRSLHRAGADFLMLGDYLWRDPRGAAAAIAEAQRLVAEA